MLKQFLITHQKRIKKILNILFQIGFIFALSVISTLWTDSNITIIQDEFIINFVGIILGLAITLLTFIYSSFDKIYSSFVKVKDEARNKKVQTILQNAFKELIQDTYFVMLIFGVLIITVILQNTDIPVFEWPIKIISKCDAIIFCKYFCFFAVCISIFDMIISLFKMMNTINFDISK